VDWLAHLSAREDCRIRHFHVLSLRKNAVTLKLAGSNHHDNNLTMMVVGMWSLLTMA
jgi:hypothetical protein